jgi:acetoin utilization deacetylase AcuC-like enzyme
MRPTCSTPTDNNVEAVFHGPAKRSAAAVVITPAMPWNGGILDTMNIAIVWDEAYAEHDTGAHPEGSDRISAVVDHLRGTDVWPRLTVAGPQPASEDDILRIHTRAYVDLVRQAAASGGQWLDPDTHVSPRSYEIALLSAGGALSATRLWQKGLVSFALIRPPGHHATPDRAMGFCLFNNVAIAAASLLQDGLERVAIVDWDVHHGNGTQAAFYRDPRVLYVSLHQWPHYPGSGFFTECGEGEGEGYTVNMPLPAGSNDGDYESAFASLIQPVVTQFAPQVLLVSAGQDIHADDPLGSMVVTEAGFATMALRCARLAGELCEGRLAFVLEGGYDRAATGRAVEAVLRAVADERAPDVGVGTERAAAAIARARETQTSYWDLPPQA